MTRWLFSVAGVFCVWQGWEAFEQREEKQDVGVIAAEEPRQTMPPREAGPVQRGKFVITPLADYEITARLLSRERYWFDASAAVSPVDFALGWGRMSDSAVLEKLSISQGQRQFSWFTSALPLPRNELTEHAANVHLIPANDSVRDDLLRLRVGQLVTLVGRLVSVSSADGFVWTSSLTRSDSGNGSCELMLVEQAFPRVVKR